MDIVPPNQHGLPHCVQVVWIQEQQHLFHIVTHVGVDDVNKIHCINLHVCIFQLCDIKFAPDQRPECIQRDVIFSFVLLQNAKNLKCRCVIVSCVGIDVSLISDGVQICLRQQVLKTFPVLDKPRIKVCAVHPQYPCLPECVRLRFLHERREQASVRADHPENGITRFNDGPLSPLVNHRNERVYGYVHFIYNAFSFIGSACIP